MCDDGLAIGDGEGYATRGEYRLRRCQPQRAGFARYAVCWQRLQVIRLPSPAIRAVTGKYAAVVALYMNDAIAL